MPHNIFQNIINWFKTPVEQAAGGPDPRLAAAVTFLSRWLLPLLAIVIVVRIAVSLLRWKREPEVWGHIALPGGIMLPINHWENLIGRAKGADILINYPSVSRNHAVLVREDDGSWTITDLRSKTGMKINGKDVSGSHKLGYSDKLSLGGVDMRLIPASAEERKEGAFYRTKPGARIRPFSTFLLITLFQLVTAAALVVNVESDALIRIPISFLVLCAVMWVYYLVVRSLRRTGFEVESIAFFLSTIGFAVIASSSPAALYKQLAAFGIGLAVFIVLGWLLRDLGRSVKLRWFMAAGALGLLALTLLFGREVYGAKNWIFIGPLSIQPSEIAKIAFVYAGAATLDRLMMKRNLWMFLLLSAGCIGMLALMNDFGTAAIFFVTFVVIAFLRSGDFSAILLSGAGAGLFGFLVFKFKPYVLNRFRAWRKVWDYAATLGYQQTRTLTYAASGGLLGVGLGNGWLKHVAAADTDLVFGFLCEEWGLLVALCAVVAIIVLAVFCVKSAGQGRSSFFVISACAAMCMLTVQTMLNVFGSVDILPLTGVTFPFVSNGGSSMISSWGLLAFVKAADTRQNASFAIKLEKRLKGKGAGGA